MSTLWTLPKIEIIPWRDLQEVRSVGVVTTHASWQAEMSKLPFEPVWVGEVQTATTEEWDRLSVKVQGDVIYALGGGLAADAGKYLAAKHELPLVCLPTALSTDAFLTPYAEALEGKSMQLLRSVSLEHVVGGMFAANPDLHVPIRPAETVVIDFDLIASAPDGLRAAGICDVLSIATASVDWHFAAVRRKNQPETPYLPFIVQAAQGALQGAYDCAEAAERGNPAGMKQLLDCMCLEVELCNLTGHSRLKIGSEHYIAWAIDQVVASPDWPHAWRLAPGLLLAAELLDHEAGHLRRSLKACHIGLAGAPLEIIQSVLGGLAEYCHHQGFPYGVAFELTPTRANYLNVKEILEIE
jgi:glycerol-1-phosphate dehydrogenase [NAD(P)+]